MRANSLVESVIALPPRPSENGVIVGEGFEPRPSMDATGMGDSVEQARSKAYELARKVVVPNMRYRNDIGQRVINGGWSSLKELGYLV